MSSEISLTTARVLFAFLVVVDADVARDQAAKGIEGEAADGSFDAAFVQLFDDEIAPVRG